MGANLIEKDWGIVSQDNMAISGERHFRIFQFEGKKVRSDLGLLVDTPFPEI